MANRSFVTNVRPNVLSILPAIAMLQQEPQIDLGFIRFIREHRGKALGDPVGKQYCQVHFRRNWYDRPAVFEAWVDPKTPDEALFWNGLTYPIEKVLRPANLDAAKKRAMEPYYGGGPISFWEPYEFSFSPRPPSPGDLALWFMLGEVEVATKLARHTLVYARSHPPTLDMALSQWLMQGYRRKFARAFLAFQDEEALQNLELLAGLPGAETNLQYGEIPAKQLIAEVRRHMGKPLHPKATTQLEMIRNLEDLTGHGVWIGPPPVLLGQISAQGANIVPELIHASKTDQRLTRAPSLNITGPPAVATVASIASSFLRSFWPEMAFYPWVTEEILQDRWKQHRDLTPGERLVAMIKDPEITPQLTGLVRSRLSHINQGYSKPSLAYKLEIDRLRPQLREPLRERAVASVASIDSPGLSEWDRKRAFESALGLVTSIATRDYDAGGDSLRTLVKMSIPEWDKRGSTQPTDVLESISVGIRNNDPEIVSAYRQVCERKDRLKAWVAYALPGLHRPANGEARAAAMLVVRDAESEVRYNSNPDQAIRVVQQVCERDSPTNLSYPQLRSFLRLALTSPAYILVEGGPNYRKVLNTGYHFSLTLPEGAPDLMRLFVRDLTAHYLCKDFETGVDFSFFESEEIKSEKREQIRAWLLNLPNEPVKRRVPDYLRRPTPGRTPSNGGSRWSPDPERRPTG